MSVYFYFYYYVQTHLDLGWVKFTKVLATSGHVFLNYSVITAINKIKNMKKIKHNNYCYLLIIN